MNPTEPMAQLGVLLGEITKMPLGPERDKKCEEAYALFGPAAEELSLLSDTISVFAERNKNGETLKSFMKQAGFDTDAPIAKVIPINKNESKLRTFGRSVANIWNSQKGKIAVYATLTAALFFYANQRNIKMLNDFTHDNDLVGLFEDWLQLEDENDRETPLDWREREGA
ncbi:hypothetical protein PP914_gp077 [Arthrobacter phage Qui]|uniref:Uncharacterized protein n=1 Tax=Arthrobacter phage Qui TaxID=2603260 RepID=A0A5B8WIH0_9CAUD|nr:hypothetical protein PP914_gp077 [Arthrobacter phage Qui]QED11567.1 hypothetical protein SEA_QUI_77 [Arthrobacter phage Qui]QOC56399.1 hypothetical protein SEA_PAELLA_77 [Arthrobacter phage Paella]